VSAETHVPEVEVVVVRDYDGYFERLTRHILARAVAIGHVVKHKRVLVDAGPWRANALSVHEIDGGMSVRLDFYSALRTGFGSLSAQDLDDAARLL
jgi:hypothetical protein